MQRSWDVDLRVFGFLGRWKIEESRISVPQQAIRTVLWEIFDTILQIVRSPNSLNSNPLFFLPGLLTGVLRCCRC